MHGTCCKVKGRSYITGTSGVALWSFESFIHSWAAKAEAFTHGDRLSLLKRS